MGASVVVIPVSGLDATQAAVRFGEGLAEVCGRSPPEVAEAPEFAGLGAFVPERCRGTALVTRLHTPLAMILAKKGGERIYADDVQRCALERQQTEHSKVITCPSRWLARQVSLLWNLPEVPLVIPNPAPERARSPQLPPFDERRPLRVLYFGRLEYRKGVLVLAEALRLLHEDGWSGDCTFVGADTKYRGRSVLEMLQHLLAPLIAGASCRLLPSCHGEHLRSILDESDVVVIPSLYENFPYTCLEAMARGKPVLGTSDSGIAEIIASGETGILVPPGDAGALSCALRTLSADPPLLRRLGERAWEAVADLGVERVVPKLVASYSEALEG